MAMWVRRLFLLAFLLALALPAASQTQQPNSSGGVIKSCTELVVLDAQVRRRSGETRTMEKSEVPPPMSTINTSSSRDTCCS